MHIFASNKYSLKLTPNECARLEMHAKGFCIQFLQVAPAMYELCAIGCTYEQVVVLPREVAHLRLFTEICSRAANWVHFYLGKSAKDSLFELSDARLARISDLYRRQSATPF
jgi:hypothetical protein